MPNQNIPAPTAGASVIDGGYKLPDEILLTIFDYLLEQDLCHVGQVCKRFQAIANDTKLWKRLYQSVYKYDLPLFKAGPHRFEFISPEEFDYPNPWKKSFRQLYHGVHVRPGYQNTKFKGRNLSYFNTVQGALDYAKERRSASSSSSSTNRTTTLSNQSGAPHNRRGALVFLHAGAYSRERIVVDSDITLIAAAAGNVVKTVPFFPSAEFFDGAEQGHLILKLTPDVTSIGNRQRIKVELYGNCTTGDFLIIDTNIIFDELYIPVFLIKRAFFYITLKKQNNNNNYRN